MLLYQPFENKKSIIKYMPSNLEKNYYTFSVYCAISHITLKVIEESSSNLI